MEPSAGNKTTVSHATLVPGSFPLLNEPDRTLTKLPAQVGRFRVDGPLGSGGMGLVCLGFDPRFQRRVAIKVMKYATSDPERIARFRGEAVAQARVVHPHVVTVYDSGEIESEGTAYPYFVMECPEHAEPLSEKLREPTWPIEVRMLVALQLCEAVSAVHGKEQIHGDLKPANTLIVPDSQNRPWVKLIDFGLATGARQFVLDMPAVRGGTPGYMAPELYRDGELPSYQSDLYALGVTVYEVLSGKHFRSDVPLQESAPGIDSILNEVVARALRSKPGDRYHTVREFSDALRAWSRNPVRRARAWLGERCTRAWPRRVFQACAVGVGVVVALHVAPWPLFQWTSLGHRLDPPRIALIAPEADDGAEVRIIALRDEPAALAAAEQAGIARWVLDSPKGLRAVHALLAGRLAQARPTVALWRVLFRDPSEHDRAFAESLSALATAGVSVVLPTDRWPTTATAAGVPPPALATAAGVVVAPCTDLEPKSSVLIPVAVAHGSESPLPNSSLLAAIRHRWPTGEISFGLDVAHGQVSADRLTPDLRAGAGLVQLTRRSVVCTQIGSIGESSVHQGIDPADHVAQIAVLPPKAEAWSSATMELADALRASPRALAEWCGGRVVLIADLRPGREEPIVTVATSIPSTLYHAALIERILSGELPRGAESGEQYAACAAAGALGVAATDVPARRTRKKIIRALSVVAATLCVWAVSVVLFSRGVVLYHPAALMVACATSAGAVLAIPGWGCRPNNRKGWIE